MALQQHPLSAAFPAMPEQEVEALAIDIEKHGQREPGVLFEGMVLDGWHRYLACERVGKKFLCGDFGAGDPVSFVLSRNLHRRHLTASQRAAAVVACHDWRPNGVARGALVQGMKTSEEMALEADVGERTIVHAKRAHEAGLGDAVKDGAVSARRAAEVAKLPKAKRAKALREPAPPKPDATEKLREQIEALTEERANLADTARELEDKLTAYETTDPDEQQKEIQKLQKRIVKLEAEIERITRARNDAQAKNNELIREVKRLRKRA